jgi:hypothetical protein
MMSVAQPRLEDVEDLLFGQSALLVRCGQKMVKGADLQKLQR